MATRRASDYETVLQEYQDKLEEFTLRGACGRPYVLVSRLTQWLKSVEASGHNMKPANRLLKAAYQRRHEYEPMPISYEGLTGGDDCCLLVFCILLRLGHGDLVARCFQREGKVDRSLPIDLLTLRTVLHKHSKDVNISEDEAEKLAVDFNREQWRFCPAKFELEMGRNFGKDRVLPFFVKESINSKGGTASLWQIEVLEEFVGLKLREAVRNSRYKSRKDEFGWRYQFALKSFKEGHRETYENERNAFLRLLKHEGMVRCLGEYEHQEIQGSHDLPSGTAATTAKIKATYNILLEFGDFDLEEFFAVRLPPVFLPEVGAFWKGLFEVAEALEGIHNLKIDSGGVMEEFHGWHADIKPANILSVQGKFKLADPGFAKFVRKTDKEPTAPVMGGTESYGAPERYSNGQTEEVRQTIDTWSLGCVFSIAATWVVLGCQGIGQFSTLRERAFKLVAKEQASGDLQQESTLTGRGDYFHDGKDVLTDVATWHGVLRSALRKSDTITDRVLELVDEKMLIGNAEERITAKDLCTRLKNISTLIDADVSAAKALNPVPESVMEALLVVDKEAPSRFLDLTTLPRRRLSGRPRTPSSDRRTGNSRISDIQLMKTSHRSEIFESALGAQSVDNKPRESHSDVDGPAHVEEAGRATSGLGISTVDETRSANGFGGQATSQLYRPPHRRTLSETHFQTIFQAHEELDKQKWGFRNIQIKGPVKDEFLARHFGKRDIRFLIDNGETMKGFWEEAKFVLDTLLMKAVGLDEDGMDLTFTSGSCIVEGQDKGKQFMRAMQRSGAVPIDGINTDMAKALQDILDNYLVLARKTYPPVKRNLTLIVLTDGIWKGTLDKDKVRRVVIDFCESLEKVRGRDIRIERPVSIEFIQFGKDKEATVRLRHLDDDLKWDGAPDIIDTEHWTGNIYKMLLGSFVEGWDEEEDPEVASPRSPGHLRTSPPPPPVQRMNSMNRPKVSEAASSKEAPSAPDFGPFPPTRRAQTEQVTSTNPPTRHLSLRKHKKQAP